jgi:hypothetical protein
MRHNARGTRYAVVHAAKEKGRPCLYSFISGLPTLLPVA